MAGQRSGYIKEFTPFAFDVDTVRGVLGHAGRDRFWGIETDGRLVGLVMLRFHEKYPRPSFGLAVAEAEAGRGIGAAALDFAIAWCRDQGIGEIMLKVAHGNATARRLYERRGFVVEGTCPDTGHLIHALKLSVR